MPTQLQPKLDRFAGNANRSHNGKSVHDQNRAPANLYQFDSAAMDPDLRNGDDLVKGVSNSGAAETRISSRGRGAPKDFVMPWDHTITREEYYRRQERQSSAVRT